MRLVRGTVLAAMIAAAAAATVVQVAAGPRTAVCMVCAITRGETEAEDVRAVRVHDGTEYGFCSEKCAIAFAKDPAAYLPPSFPRPAPAFSLADLSGRPVSNESLRDMIVLLDFWATWCAPCRKSMPELDALHRKYADRGFTVVGISIDEGGPAKVRKYVASKKLSYPIAVDSQRTPAWESFRVRAVPAAFLIDGEGRIVAQWTGRSAPAAEIESRLAGLLKAK